MLIYLLNDYLNNELGSLFSAVKNDTAKHYLLI